MPAREPICALRASVRRTSGNGCTGWPTPKVASGDYQYSNGDHSKPALNLAGVAKLAGWVTPQARDANGVTQNFCRPDKPKDDSLADQTLGLILSGTTAETARPAASRLNPRFSLWLMGYPAEWACSGERAMQSCRKSRPSSFSR